MARVRKPQAEEPEQSEAEKRTTKADKDLLVRIRERYKVMVEADRENRRLALDDLKFLHEPGAQWDATIKKKRGKRPAYEFNKLRIKAKRIINEMRANRPQGKVRAVEDGDKDTAVTLDGLTRNIANVSKMDTICDYAGEYQVGGGMGAWRVETKYADDSVFHQDISVSPIKNPFCLYADPAATDPFKTDGEDWILTERISKAAFEQKYGKAKKVNFDDTEFDDEDDWVDEETVRVCEYWWREFYDKEIWQLADGKVIDSTKPEAKLIDPSAIKRKRVVKCPQIMMTIVSGDAILEKPAKQAGKRHRFVQVHGEWIVLDGKVVWFGLVRHAKDAQRRYNVSQTAVTETIATAPQSKYWVTPEQAKGNTEAWNIAHEENLPFLVYTPDAKAPGPPQRMAGPDVPAALIQEAVMADQDMKDVTGVYDPALGAKSNETSGRAITRRAEQTEMVNFNFGDNMAKGVCLTWEIIIDLIPEIYDTERTIRILGVDGAEKYVKINTTTDPKTGQPVMDESGQPVMFNDLSRGKYDVTVTQGPSFSTQRQEASELYTQLLQGIPALGAVAPDLIVKTFDAPYSEEMAERLRMMLPPQIQQQLSEGKAVPPEAQAALAQAAQAMQMVQQQSQLVQAAAQEVEQNKAEAEKAKAQVDTAIANLKTEEARFEAQIAKALAGIAQKEAQIAQKGAEDGTEQDRASLGVELKDAIAQIQQGQAQFMQQAAAIIADLMARTQPQVVIPPKPRILRIERQNGAMVPIYDDQVAQ